jgi:integrase
MFKLLEETLEETFMTEWRNDKRSHEGGVKTIKGNLYARIQWIDEVTGKRKEKLRRAANRTEARKIIKEMVAELENHGEETLQSDKLTFAKLAAEYESKKLVEATFANGIKVAGKRSIMPSRSALKPLIAHFGRMVVRNIKTSDIEAYKTKRLRTPVETKTRKGVETRPRKISSVNRELEHLRAIFNFAKVDGLILRSPFEVKGNSLIVKSAEKNRDRVLSREEEGRLLEACGPRTVTYERNGKQITMRETGESRKYLRALIVVAVDTGARRGELFKLQWKDVDLISGTITIQASNSKTERARIIGLTSRAKNELNDLWEVSIMDKESLVFGVTSTIKNAWKKLCEIAGIDDLNFHDLRHTATTRMINAGVPHTEVMKITGHSQIVTFLRYLNLSNESLVRSANMLDNYLAEQSKTVDEIISETIN